MTVMMIVCLGYVVGVLGLWLHIVLNYTHHRLSLRLFAGAIIGSVWPIIAVALLFKKLS